MGRNQKALWPEGLTSYLLDVILALLLLYAILWIERAEAQPAKPDVALLVFIDTSSSVSVQEYELQKNGTIVALTGDEFWKGMGNTPIAIALAEWADDPYLVVPWTLVRNKEEMQAALAPYMGWERKTIGDGPGGRGGQHFGSTALGKSMLWAVDYMGQCGCPSARQIIDVSGDGEDNGGVDPRKAASIALQRNITINGLAIINEEKTLREYYENFVITPGDGFAVEANDFGVYERVLVRKLLLEVS